MVLTAMLLNIQVFKDLLHDYF